MRKRILWITETAVMLALLVAVQGITAGLGNQFITGSCVNLILVVTALVVGLWGGVTVAAVSPFVAFLLGIGPKFIQLVPIVALGNLVLVVIYALFLGGKKKALWLQGVTLAAAAAAKFLTLYLLMVKLVVPALVSGGTLPQKAAAAMSVQFGWPQLVTALMGGAIALAVTPALRKALKR